MADQPGGIDGPQRVADAPASVDGDVEVEGLPFQEAAFPGQATHHLQPGSPAVIPSNQATPGPTPPTEEHTPLPNGSHASPSTTEPPNLPLQQQQQQQPQPPPPPPPPQQQRVHALDSGQLVHLHNALAACKQPAGDVTTVLDLSGCTYKGKLKGPLEVPSNTSLVNGVLQLPPNAQLLIRDAHGVTLKDLVIEGSSERGLVEVCHSSSASMQGCTVQGGQAVKVWVDSSLKASECVMRSSSGCGLCVSDAGRVALDRCECECNLSKACFFLRDGCSVGKGSSLTAKGCTFRCQKGIAGLGIYWGSKAVIHGCNCSDNSDKGIWLSGHQSSLIASNCSVCRNASTNLAILECETAALVVDESGPHMSSLSDPNALAAETATAVLTGCKFDDCKCDGIQVQATHQVKATGCSASGNGMHGMTFTHGACAQLSACVVEGNKFLGLNANHSRTAISATKCLINHNKFDNICVVNGAHVDLHACEANHSKKEYGLFVRDQGSELVCSGGTRAHGNRRHNLSVSCGAVAELTADCVMSQAAQK